MPTWYLEYLWRAFNRLKEGVGKQRGGTAEKTQRAMETIEKLMETFYGEIYWSSLDNYDQIMSQIVGFKEFKQELRNQIEVAERRKRRGKNNKKNGIDMTVEWKKRGQRNSCKLILSSCLFSDSDFFLQTKYVLNTSKWILSNCVSPFPVSYLCWIQHFF